jgi:hypothetical protein
VGALLGVGIAAAGSRFMCPHSSSFAHGLKSIFGRPLYWKQCNAML